MSKSDTSAKNVITPVSAMLAGWHADPPVAGVASETLNAIERHLKRRRNRRGPSYLITLCQLITEYWVTDRVGLDRPNNEFEREHLQSVLSHTKTRRQEALGYFVVGQLLMSRKMTGALEYLDQALTCADGLLKPDEYFIVYNRHEDLRHLPLSDTGQAPQTLNTLLNEARVIQQLERDKQGWTKDNWPNQYSMP